MESVSIAIGGEPVCGIVCESVRAAMLRSNGFPFVISVYSHDLGRYAGDVVLTVNGRSTYLQEPAPAVSWDLRPAILAMLKLLNDDEIREKYEREWEALGELG